MTTGIPTYLCLWCKHLHVDEESTRSKYKCDAFSDGIPEAIYKNKFDHQHPYEGDNSIQFIEQTNADIYPFSLQIQRAYYDLDVLLQVVIDSINEPNWKYDSERYPLLKEDKE